MEPFDVSNHEIHPIRVARTSRGLSMEALGKRVGVTKATVSKWEAGASFPEPHMAFRLSQALKLPLEKVYAAARAA